MEIREKTVLITGGALRIGRALCESFAAKGARVIIHYRNSAIAAEELRRQLPNPENHRTVRADLADLDQTTQLLTECGKVDILINNAASFESRPLKDECHDDFARQMTVNFLAPLELMKQFATQPGLTEGCIINFLDQQIVRYPENSGSYLLAKKGLAEATLLAARQFAPSIRVNAVAPGPVLPPSWLKAGEGMKQVLNAVPLGKPVAMNDLTDACIFLCDNDSVTGQILFVDGGQHLS